MSSGTFTLQRYGSFFRNFSLEVEERIMWGSIQVLPNQVNEKSLYTFEDIDLTRVPCKITKKTPSETLGADSI